jgi:prolyl oligopeptidase
MRLSGAPSRLVDDVIHGVSVRDPYRWLEDRSLPATQEWIKRQQKRCEMYFANCDDLELIREQVRAYLEVEDVDQPIRIDNQYFYRRRGRGLERASIYTRDASTGNERNLVDPSAFGSFASVGIYRISDDCKLLAYGIRHGGEDRQTIRFLDIDTGDMLPDRIEAGYARGLAFAPDNCGIYYCHETDAAAQEHRILFHRFHEAVADQVIFRVTRSCEGRLVLTADGIHLGAFWTHRVNTDLMADFSIARLDSSPGWKRVFANRRMPCMPLLKFGRILTLNFDGAPHGEVIELTVSGCKIRTIVPEQKVMIRQLVVINDRLFAQHLENGKPSIRYWSLSGDAEGGIDLPADGTVQMLSAECNTESSIFYTYESFDQPLTTFEYRPATHTSQLWTQRTLPEARVHCDVRRVSFPSKDGTQIPMTLASRQESSRAKEATVIMTGYGGFGIAVTPQFSVLVAIIMQLGAVFALPHIRGGGEFGISWHDAGRAQHRQNSFDDFIAAAEWLCSAGMSTPKRLAIFGGSNSGLLVGAAMTQASGTFRGSPLHRPLTRYGALRVIRSSHQMALRVWDRRHRRRLPCAPRLLSIPPC